MTARCLDEPTTQADKAAKAARLFDVREMSAFATSCGLSDQHYEALLGKVIGLQAAIYSLDVLGETQWSVSDEDLQTAWSEIRANADDFDERIVEAGFADLRIYQDIERGLRAHLPVSDWDFASFYFAKTCDVRFMRALVAAESEHPEVVAPVVLAWRLYDDVAEVLDDLDDAVEDASSFNGNRLLCATDRLGFGIACAQYRSHLSSLERTARARATACGVGAASAVYLRTADVASSLSDRIQRNGALLTWAGAERAKHMAGEGIPGIA